MEAQQAVLRRVRGMPDRSSDRRLIIKNKPIIPEQP
jgi:hypothetical protein